MILFPCSSKVLRRNEIVSDYAHLVRPVAMAIQRKLPASFCLDDLVQTGFLGLIAAAERFDPERAETFETYARTKIAGAILDEIRPRSNRELPADGEAWVELAAREADPETELLERERAEVLRGAVKKLTPRQQQVIDIRYWQERRQREAAGELGSTQQGAQDLERRAVTALRRELKPQARPGGKLLFFPARPAAVAGSAGAAA